VFAEDKGETVPNEPNVTIGFEPKFVPKIVTGAPGELEVADNEVIVGYAGVIGVVVAGDVEAALFIKK